MKVTDIKSNGMPFYVVFGLLFMNLLPINAFTPLLAICYVLSIISIDVYLVVKNKYVGKSGAISIIYFTAIFPIYMLHWRNYFEFQCFMLITYVIAILWDVIVYKINRYMIFIMIHYLIIFIFNIPAIFGRIRGDFYFFNEWNRF